MGRASCLGRDKSDAILEKNGDFLLPLPVNSKTKFRIKALLGHCLYRRVIIWGTVVLALLVLALSAGPSKREALLDLVDFRKEAQEPEEEKPPEKPWEPEWFSYPL
jgi:hypothetical protein